MRLDKQQILSISRDLWATQLGLSIAPSDSGGESACADRTFATQVKVSGSWHGTIRLQCPESVARHAAAMLFAADGDQATDEDVQDALGELADMMAKKIRAFLPDESKLSRPAAIPADEPLEGLREIHGLDLSCEGRPVRIVLLECEHAPASAA